MKASAERQLEVPVYRLNKSVIQVLWLPQENFTEKSGSSDVGGGMSRMAKQESMEKVRGRCRLPSKS